MTPADLLREYGRGWALQLVPLCSPENPHGHGGVPCPSPGKIPLTPRWQMLPDRRRETGVEPETVASKVLLHLEQGGNVGLAVPSGVLVLDADTAEATARLARALPDAPLQRTSAGAHLVTRLPEGRSVVNTCKVLLEYGLEVDLRGQGAQVVCWPSIHHTGAEYVWERPLPKTRAELPLIPGAWLTSLDSRCRGNGAREPAEWLRVVRDGVTEGSRHSTLLAVAGKFFGSNLDPALAYQMVHLFNRANCKPPLPDAEVDQVACDIAAKELGRHRVLKIGGREVVV